jgi:hypothetical protein
MKRSEILTAGGTAALGTLLAACGGSTASSLLVGTPAKKRPPGVCGYGYDPLTNTLSFGYCITNEWVTGSIQIAPLPSGGYKDFCEIIVNTVGGVQDTFTTTLGNPPKKGWTEKKLIELLSKYGFLPNGTNGGTMSTTGSGSTPLMGATWDSKKQLYSATYYGNDPSGQTQTWTYSQLAAPSGSVVPDDAAECAAAIACYAAACAVEAACLLVPGIGWVAAAYAAAVVAYTGAIVAEVCGD